MAYPKVLFLGLAIVLGLSQGAFVDTLHKCKLDDSECQKITFQSSLPYVADNGIPELGVEPLDPIKLKGIKMSILNIIDFKLLDGTAKGLKGCVFNQVYRDMQRSLMTINITCDVVVRGRYHVRTTSGEIKNLLGADIYGKGNGGVDIKQVNVIMQYPIAVKKRGDDLYLKGDLDKVTHNIEILGNMKFFADNLYLGDKESSAEVVNMLNQNWRLLVGAFGNSFFDIAIDVVTNFLKKLCNEIPAKHYILDDLKPYLK